MIRKQKRLEEDKAALVTEVKEMKVRLEDSEKQVQAEVIKKAGNQRDRLSRCLDETRISNKRRKRIEAEFVASKASGVNLQDEFGKFTMRRHKRLNLSKQYLQQKLLIYRQSKNPAVRDQDAERGK